MIQKISGSSNSSLVQLIRYGFVAVIAFAIDFGLLFVFTNNLHFYYLVSACLSFFISLVVNYILSTKWVFPYSRKSKAYQIMGFILIGLAGLGLNLLIIWALTSKFGIYYLFSKIIAIVIVFFGSFIGRKILLKNPDAPVV